MSPPKQHDSDWDQWFHEAHDGSPVEWFVCTVRRPGDDDKAVEMSLCCSKGPGTRNNPEAPEHVAVSPDEEHIVLHRFFASSSHEASQKQYDLLGWGTYKPA